MPPKKRNLKEVETLQPGTRRKSSRLSSTGKKSSYFEDDVDDSDTDGPPRKATKSTPNLSRSKRKSHMDASDDEDKYESEDIDGEENEESDAFDEDEDSATPPPPKRTPGKRGRSRLPNGSTSQSQKATSRAAERAAKSSPGVKKRGRPANAPASPSTKRQRQVTRNGEEDEDGDDAETEDDEDDEPQVTFIPLPQLRDTDGVEYEDTKVHPNTLLFLGDLKANNKRSWLKSEFNVPH